MRKIIIIVNIIITFLSCNCFAEVNSQKMEEPIRELIIRLNNEYISLEESLRKFEKNIWDFPTTILNLSIIKRSSDINITSIEIYDNSKLLEGHIYTPIENEAINSGGRHQLYNKEIAGGNRNLGIIYFWTEKDKPQQKGELSIPLNISRGKDVYIELSLEKRKDKVELRVSKFEFDG
ncbi:MAG: hypothetical protein HY096_04425 [Nitrospinae bacterium]|nr:hypothetical protein [Nitrospinota bacterium]MBI5748730.1 hypothetical protein [Nitrospinota bacterium]